MTKLFCLKCNGERGFIRKTGSNIYECGVCASELKPADPIVFGIVTAIGRDDVCEVMLTELSKINGQWYPAGAIITARRGPLVTIDSRVAVEEATAYCFEYRLILKKAKVV